MNTALKKFISLILIVAFLPVTSSGGFAKLNVSVGSPDKNQVVIRVIDGGWGTAQAKDIQAVLYFMAGELLEYFPEKHLYPIIVEHDEAGPITLYRRGTNKEHLVQLDVEDENWGQLVYQFSHELTHVLATRDDAKVKRHPNKWFEEVLCLTASLFTLRRMAVSRRPSPPQLIREHYPLYFRMYADYHMSKPRRELSKGVTLAKWYKENAWSLRNDDVGSEEARNKQYVIASQFLPIFERNPELWESVSYLNAGKPDKSDSFDEYVSKWYANSPEKHKKLIRELIEMLRE